jgi:hypothetical protein
LIRWSTIRFRHAWARFNLVDGDPLRDIKLVANPARNFVLMMKDGKIYKNTLPK